MPEEKKRRKENSINDVVERGKVVAVKSAAKTTRRKNKNKKVKTKKKKPIAKLNTSLVNILEESQEVDIFESSTRKKIVPWNDVAEMLTTAGWFTINNLTDYVESNYNKNKLHYSEALRFIRTASKLWNVQINKREVDSGPDKGVYYRFSLKK